MQKLFIKNKGWKALCAGKLRLKRIINMKFKSDVMAKAVDTACDWTGACKQACTFYLCSQCSQEGMQA